MLCSRLFTPLLIVTSHLLTSRVVAFHFVSSVVLNVHKSSYIRLYLHNIETYLQAVKANSVNQESR